METDDIHRKKAEAKRGNVLGSDASRKDAESVKPGITESKDIARDDPSTSEGETQLGRGDSEPADAKVRDEQSPELSPSPTTTSPTVGEELEWKPRGKPTKPSGGAAQKPPKPPARPK